MLRTSGPPANPEIQRVVENLLREDLNFDRTDNRSAHRDHLVRPVAVELRSTGEVVTAFSRNISVSGIGLITHEPIADRTVAVLKISRLAGDDSLVLAECRWTKTYGLNWHLSGWQFIGVKKR